MSYHMAKISYMELKKYMITQNKSQCKFTNRPKVRFQKAKRNISTLEKMFKIPYVILLKRL